MNQDRLPDIDNGRVAYQQILEKDHSVYSIQWLIIPDRAPQVLTSMELLQLYLGFVERFTLGLVRPLEYKSGISFRLFTTRIALISFDSPVTEQKGSGEKTILPIAGGLLTQPQERSRGQLGFFVEAVPKGSRLTLRLAGYYPLLLGSYRPSPVRKLLYRLTQAYLHKIVTLRFLAMVYRQATGRKLQKGAVRIEVRKGMIT